MEREKTDIFSRESQRESGRKGKLQRACLAGRGNKKKIKGGTFFTWGADITGCRQLSGRGEGLEPQVAEETAREVTEYGDSRSPSLSLSLSTRVLDSGFLQAGLGDTPHSPRFGPCPTLSKTSIPITIPIPIPTLTLPFLFLTVQFHDQIDKVK